MRCRHHHHVGVIWFPRRDDTLVFLIGDFTKRFMTPVVAMPSVIMRNIFQFFPVPLAFEWTCEVFSCHRRALQ